MRVNVCRVATGTQAGVGDGAKKENFDTTPDVATVTGCRMHVVCACDQKSVRSAAVSVGAQLASDRRQTHSRLFYLPHAERSADTCMQGSDA